MAIPGVITVDEQRHDPSQAQRPEGDDQIVRDAVDLHLWSNNSCACR